MRSNLWRAYTVLRRYDLPAWMEVCDVSVAPNETPQQAYLKQQGWRADHDIRAGGDIAFSPKHGADDRSSLFLAGSEFG